MTSDVVLSARNLTVHLGGRPVVDDLNLQVHKGQWLGILGPNGSGKTTFLRAAAGLIPYSGRLELLGRSVKEWPSQERARRIAFVQQQLGLSFDFSVLELVMLGRTPHKPWLSGFNRADRERGITALETVDLEGFQDRSMLALSGGEQRRVLLAQALVQDAEILLLDEPTSHLDVHHRFGFLDHVRTLVEAGRSVVGVFHDLELAARYSDRLAVIQNGRLVRLSTPEAVLEPELIADVFGMETEVDTSHGTLRVHYARPLRQNGRNGGPVGA